MCPYEAVVRCYVLEGDLQQLPIQVGVTQSEDLKVGMPSTSKWSSGQITLERIPQTHHVDIIMIIIS
jgi:hypothetical protein